MNPPILDQNTFDSEFNPLAVRDDIICDGCNVNEPHEHKCHIHNIVVRGEFTDFNCECIPCRKLHGTKV